MEGPEVRYVITDDDVRIAYQEFGSGPPTILVQTLLGHIEAVWDLDHLRRLFERVAANLRILTFDHRGNGLSDGFSDSPSLDDRTLDVKAVMDAAGVEQANLLAYQHGAQVAIGFAAKYPERVERLVLVNTRTGPSGEARADELNPGAEDPGPLAGTEATLRRINTVGIDIDDSWTYFSPSLAKYPDVRDSLTGFQRLVGSRDVFKRQFESQVALDVGQVAPLVRAPTLVSHARGNRLIHVGYARLMAELIPDSTLHEFEGDDQMYWLADNWREIVDAHITFITGSEVDSPTDRRFAVVLFTDIVDSTSTSLASGDDEWHRRLDTHDRISQRIITRHDGTIVKNTGDGILATFSAPSQAVDAAIQLRDELAELGIRVRAGIHAGEIEERGADITGGVVNLAARVEQAAAADDIYTTKTVRDMLIGSPHNFEDAGSHRLKGFDEEWALYLVATTSPRP